MPRERKRVARFDPSPEAVASWNNTSQKMRNHVVMQARVRHGLASPGAAAAPTTTPADVADSNAVVEFPTAGRSQTNGREKRPMSRASAHAGSRKRPRPPNGTSSSAPPVPLTELRVGGRINTEGGDEGDEGDDGRTGEVDLDAHGGAEDSAKRVASSVTDSSANFGTSGSDSESYDSHAPPTSDLVTLPWRAPEVNRIASQTVESSTSEVAYPARTSESATDYSDLASTPSIVGSDTFDHAEEAEELASGEQATVVASTSAERSCDVNPREGTHVDHAEHGEHGELDQNAHGDNLAETGGEIHPPANAGRGDVDAGCGTAEQGAADEPPQEAERNVVTVRIAKCQMPSRWAQPPEEFISCLETIVDADTRPMDLGGGDSSADAAACLAASLMGLTEGDGVDGESWLTSAFIDVVMAKLARSYPEAHFMPVEFAALCLRGFGSDNQGRSTSSASSASTDDGAQDDTSLDFRDILGQKIVYAEKRPVVFLTNANNKHWNLLRVVHRPTPELQLFESMGKPAPRQASRKKVDGRTPGSGASIGFRCIPREVYAWLNAAWPLTCRSSGKEDESLGADEQCPSSAQMTNTNGKRAAPGKSTASGRGSGSGARKKVRRNNIDWASIASSAITSQHQTSSFDCGVAALLYAEKCGMGLMREDINAYTNQQAITEYRQVLKNYAQGIAVSVQSSSSQVPPGEQEQS